MPGFFAPIFHLSFWLQVPDALSPKIGLGIFCFMLALLIIWVATQLIEYFARRNKVFRDRWKLEKPLRRELGRISEFCFWAGASGLLWYWLVTQRIPFFGMRIVFLIWLMGFAVWAAFIIRDIVRRKNGMSEEEQRLAYEKWLPKSKKT
ncbi:hypothetical protein EXS71_03780 [Candidatus Uhrbacteria bacterium]|nr:hypothetical protein [Candidatus Uhrbacteria bacterium]